MGVKTGRGSPFFDLSACGISSLLVTEREGLPILRSSHGNERVHLGLGSNVGDKRANLVQAVRLLAADVRIVAASSLYRTAPVGFIDQDWFLNVVLCVETQLHAHQLLAKVREIEQQLGRVRRIRDGPRSIDIDILLWGELVCSSDRLTIPHLSLHARRFVLAPLAEIDPQVVHPILGASMAELLAALGPGQAVEVECGPEWASD